MRAGCGKADITPPVGLPLSGFAVRQDRPSVAVDDPLQVKALVIEQGAEAVLLLSYDLLGFDRPLDNLLRSSLQQAFGKRFAPGNMLITTTHTHSGPTTMPIAGETRVPEAYIQKIIEATEFAVQDAINDLADAELVHSSVLLEGINHNRREQYAPGRQDEGFPLDKTLDLFLFRMEHGIFKGGFVRFSCHAVTMLTQRFSADYPGELTRRLEEQYGAPVLFLEGTAGDSNPTTHTEDHTAMMAFVDQMMMQMGEMAFNLSPVPGPRMRLVSRSFQLPLAPLPSRAKVEERIELIDRILSGDLTSPDLQPLVNEFSAWRALDEDDIPGTVMHWAKVFRASAQLTLHAINDPRSYEYVSFNAAGLLLGDYLLLFLAGEILTRIGMKLQELAPEKMVKVISYLSPIVGYIADQQEFELGGYELDNAWLWYGMPGPFHREVEKSILEGVSGLFNTLLEEEKS